MPVRYYGIIGLIVLAYLGAAEVTKHVLQEQRTLPRKKHFRKREQGML